MNCKVCSEIVKKKLRRLDMRINAKKSCCLHIGPRFNATCTCVITSDGHSLPCVSQMRYLGIYFVAGRNTRCSVSYAKRSFYRSSNAIFGKVGKHASEEVTLQLVKSKCMPMLLYGLECFALLKSDVKSIDFAVTTFLMKLFSTSSTDVINDCRTNFSFMLPSEMIEIRKAKFEIKFNTCNSLRYYFGL